MRARSATWVRESEYLLPPTVYSPLQCHCAESAYMQEIAQEVAMRHRQHVWVDGSLSDGAWFSKVFQDIRKRYPHYRIAIIHITASEGTIRERIQQRAALTGRSIPESQIARSLECPEQSIKASGRGLTE